jgi:hypothetical protein
MTSLPSHSEYPVPTRKLSYQIFTIRHTPLPFSQRRGKFAEDQSLVTFNAYEVKEKEQYIHTKVYGDKRVVFKSNA